MSDRQRNSYMDRDEVKWRGAMKRMLLSQRDKVLERVNELNIPEAILEELPKYIKKGDTLQEYQNLYVGLGEKYYEWSQQNVKSGKILIHTQKKLDPSDPYFRNMAEFVENQVASRIVSITDTTRKAAERAIKGAIEEGIADGLGIREMSKKVEQAVMHEWRIQTSFRPDRIARTEMSTAMNHASFMGAKNTGVEFMKSWMTARDMLVRDTHIAAGMEPPIKKESRFNVGGSMMMYPGDAGAPAAEVVYCRCNVAYITDPREF